MRAQEDLGSFAEFEFENYEEDVCIDPPATLPPPRCAVKTSPPSCITLMVSPIRNTDDVPGKLSSTVATTQVRLRSWKARNEIENDGERLAKTGLVTPIFGSDSFSNLERPLCLLLVVVAEQIVTMIKDDPF
jgi:hypothetical protein